jgi:hypothetical protein
MQLEHGRLLFNGHSSIKWDQLNCMLGSLILGGGIWGAVFPYVSSGSMA